MALTVASVDDVAHALGRPSSVSFVQAMAKKRGDVLQVTGAGPIFALAASAFALVVVILLFIGVASNFQSCSTSLTSCCASRSVRHMAYVFSVITTFMIVGPALILLNKHIMDAHHFHYPLMLSSFGAVASMIFSQVVVRLGFDQVRRESADMLAGLKWFRVALPIGAAKALTLSIGNAVYLHLGLGFIQMLKALTPLIVLVVMCVFGVRRPTRSAIAFVFVILAGTVMEIHGELVLSIMGVALMLTSQICEAVSLVLTQKLLQDCNLSVMEGMYLLSPPTVLSLGIISLWLEVPQMASSGDYVIIAQNPGDFVGASALGLFVNFATFFLVQATSSLFAKILNTARCIGVVVIGVLFYGEVVGLLEGVGYAIALFGFAGYTFVQLFPEAGLRLEKAVDCCSGSSGASLDEQTGGKAKMAAILKKPEADHGGKANQPSECFSTSEQRNAV